MSKARELAELSRTVSDSADAVAITIDASENVTFSAGIDVTDTVTADGLTVDGDSITANAQNAVTIEFSGAEGVISADRTGGNFGELSFKTTAGAAPLSRLKIAYNGDISFYEDTGTTPKLFWDASAESLGIGTSSVSAGFVLEGVGDARFGDVAGDDAVEIGWSGGGGYAFVQAFDRSATAQRDLLLNSSLRIDSSGNVGIGISNPTEKFTVVNSSSGIVGRFTNNTNQTLDLGVISGSGAAGGVYYNNANSGYHAFQIGGTERMRIDASGNIFLQTGGAALQWQNGYQTITGDAASNDLTYRTYQNHIWKNTTGASSTTDGTERMRIDSNGQIYAGGGPQSIAKFTGRANGAAVEFGHGNNSAGYYGTAGSFGSSGLPYIGFSADAEASVDTFTTRGFKGNLIAGENTGALRFLQLTNASATGQTPTERMRILANGTLLVGKTADDNSVGFKTNTNSTYMVASGQTPTFINRLSSAGDLIEFRKDSATKGRIGTDGSDIYIGSDDCNLFFFTNAVLPVNSVGGGRDDALSLGASTTRFKNLYLSGGAYLGGTVAANKLDDYEEGTWTPNIQRFDGSVPASFSVHSGSATYTKIGNTVNVNAFINSISAGSSNGSNYWVIYGIPFAAQVIDYTAGILGYNGSAANGLYVGDASGNAILTFNAAPYSGSLSGQFMLNITYRVT